MWMVIWVHPYAVPPLHCGGGVNFRKNGAWLSLYNVVRSWLRLQTPIDCIPHPCWMYTHCLSTLRCCGWAYHGYTLMPEYIVQVGVNFRKNGVWPSLYDVLRSWLRLQTPIDCIPHLYWMYTKCLSTLRCCGWAYGGCTLTLIPLKVSCGFLENMGKGWVWVML